MTSRKRFDRNKCMTVKTFFFLLDQLMKAIGRQNVKYLGRSLC